MSKWYCEVIKNNDNKYYANMYIEGKIVSDLPMIVDYKTLRESIKNIAGISILKCKDMIFEKLSETEKIATIDATQYRGEGKDCRVTIEERIKGWKPTW